MTEVEATAIKARVRQAGAEAAGSWSESTVLRLVDHVYDAAGDPSRWGAVLERFQDALEGTAAYMHRVDVSTTTTSVIAAVRIDAAALDSLEAHYASTSPAYREDRWRLLESGIVGSMNWVVPVPEWDTSEYNADWLRPQTIYANLGGTIRFTSTGLTGFDLFRPISSPPYTARDLGLVYTLMPHLQRALELHDHLDGFHLYETTVDDALESLSIAVALLDASARVVAANAAARSACAQRDGLSLSDRRLTPASIAARDALDAIVQDAVTTGAHVSATGGGHLRLARPSGRPPWQLRVCALRARDNDFATRGVAAAVFIGESNAPGSGDSRAIQAAFRLSDAELSVCLDLARGCSMAAIADAQLRSRETVRTHAKRVFEKVGVRGHADLVRVLNRLSRPHVNV